MDTKGMSREEILRARKQCAKVWLEGAMWGRNHTGTTSWRLDSVAMDYAREEFPLEKRRRVLEVAKGCMATTEDGFFASPRVVVTFDPPVNVLSINHALMADLRELMANPYEADE